MFTILHLSDLHRSTREPFSNDEIISSLRADIDRYHIEDPAISAPDAIIVSGDLVQGLPLGSLKYPAELIDQYSVAVELLQRLADSFLAGDRAKLVIIPGNHDVDFNGALIGMSEVTVRSRKDITGFLHDDRIADNPHRWSWKEGKLYKISDVLVYEDRFKYYCDAFSQFYDGVPLAYPVDPTEYHNLFELDEGRIVVAAFNSCHQNDCHNYVGDIPRGEIAKAHLKIENSGKKYELRMAVWHHDVVGPPKRIDYMDGAVVKLMIDKGFRLGLHGHQHKAQTIQDFIHTSRRATMAVVCAGSLCAGVYDMPGGVSREYNVIEIASCYTKARVHVREAKMSAVFAAGRFIDLGGESYEDVRWTSTPPIPPLPASGESVLDQLTRIEAAIDAGNPGPVIAELVANTGRFGRHGRRLLAQSFEDVGMWPDLESHLASPENADEGTSLVTALIKQKKWASAKAWLKTPGAQLLLGAATIGVLENRVSAEEAMSP